jgi:hypothetical protein
MAGDHSRLLRHRPFNTQHRPLPDRADDHSAHHGYNRRTFVGAAM